MDIVQITDLHIDLSEEKPFGIDVKNNFLKILNATRLRKPDHLIISGDLCYREGEEKIYRWIKVQLDRSGLPYDIIAGNHDNTLMMAQAFKLEHLLTDQELFYSKKIGKQHCIFLDSGKGQHSENQLKWLKRQLHNANKEVIIFMHHPPVICGTPFMDNNHALKDMDAIQKILFQHPHNVAVFCGHYHIEKTVRLKNIQVHITPSCFFQIDQQEKVFKVDHHRIALRSIQVENQQLLTSVHYFEGQ